MLYIYEISSYTPVSGNSVMIGFCTDSSGTGSSMTGSSGSGATVCTGGSSIVHEDVQSGPPSHCSDHSLILFPHISHPAYPPHQPPPLLHCTVIVQFCVIAVLRRLATVAVIVYAPILL